MSAILTDTKKLLGIDSTYAHFDADIIVGINAAFATLTQLGVTKYGFAITGTTEQWSDYDVDDATRLSLVKQYVYLKTRRMFDPPASSSVMQAIDNEIKEFEWRLCAESTPEEE